MTRRFRRRVARRSVAKRPGKSARQRNRLPPLPRQPLHNLPTQLTSFIGREREIVEIKRLLVTTRLLTLTGSGGCGKTRLALHVAASLLEHYPDGIWFAQFASLSNPTLVPKAVASGLGLPDYAGRPLTETVIDYLRPRAALLIVDNCEHLVRACADLADALLRACPNLRILATSREILGVEGELAYRVPSLQLPDPSRLPDLAKLAEYEAVRLFTERAIFSQPQFTLTAGNASIVTQICYRLDGIPLAIEFAAAWVKMLSVDQIAGRLDGRFDLLAAGTRKTLPRHQTLRATMDWSYGLLSEEEQTVLRRVSVFAGGWTLEAAEAICSGGAVEASKILDLLTQLVNKSLVFVETPGGGARYRLLETVRQYSQERLQELGEADEVRRRHRDWYLALAERAGAQLHGPEQEAWLHRLETDHDNMRAALAWSKTGKGGVEGWLRLAGALYSFWNINGHWSEGRRWLEEALAQSGEAQPSTLLRALDGAAILAYQQGDYKRSGDLTEQVLALGQKLEDQYRITRAIIGSGLLAFELGDHGRATALLEEGVTRSRELADKWLLGFALQQLADTVREQGDCKRAARLGMESVTLYRELGDKWRTAVGLRAMGIVALRQRDYGQATAFFTESLNLCQGTRNRWVSFQCLEGLACIARARRLNQRAAILSGAAEALRESLHARRDTDHQAEVDHHMNSTRTALGDTAFLAAQAEGRAMTLEQVMDFVLTAAEPCHTMSQEPARPVIAKRAGLLAPREREVAALVAEGKTNREIATHLSITEGTVEAHVQHILNKLGVNSRAQIAAWIVTRQLQGGSPTKI